MLKKMLVVLCVLLLCNFAQAQGNRCDVPDVGTLSPHELKTKKSLTHYWQGAKGGLNTKNADRTTISYRATKGNQKLTKKYEKCLLAIPERFILGMIERGWILRNKNAAKVIKP